jgi:hypothetical protein
LKNRKLYYLLSDLGNRERSRLRDYLHSPYFHPLPELNRLFDLLEEDYRALGLPYPEPAAVWARLYPDRAYEDLAFRTMSSQLLRKIEGFLEQEALQDKPVWRERMLLAELEKRRLDRHLHYVLQRSRKTLEQNPQKDSEQQIGIYHLELAQHRFNARQAIRSQKLAPAAALSALDNYYIGSRLRLACEILNLQHIVQIPEQAAAMEEVEGLLRRSRGSGSPSVLLYGSVWTMLRAAAPGEAEAAYRELRGHMENQAGFLPQEEQYEIWIHAINFCIRQANRGQIEYLRELLGLYQEALQRDLLLERGQLSPSNYKNMVTVGLRVGEYTWVRRFIQTYREVLPPAFRDNAYTYNLAVYYYTLGHYEQVLELLREVEYDDVFYNLDSKVLLLKVYYETEESDALFSLFDSFAVFLKRNKVLSGYHKTINLNLIRYLKRLSRLPPGKSKALEELQQRVEATREISALQWLTEKLEQKRLRRNPARERIPAGRIIRTAR